MAAAFGGNTDRKLDNTTVGITANPGPGTYNSLSTPIKAKGEPSAVFASKNYSRISKKMLTDPDQPGPNAYNLADFDSLAKKPLQGGAPNNVLALKRAENKKLQDAMFPFIVRGRMEEDARTLEMTNLGPGAYSPKHQFSGS